MFALNSDNRIVNIKDAIKKQDYYCANCGGVLRVREGKIKIKHFYHLHKDCGDKGESLIHRYWKEYYSNLKEFEGYKIIETRTKVQLLNGKYIPDIVLKTDKAEYIIIEICYKNSKTEDYMEKFIKLKKLKKVYEIKVDFDEIIETKVLYDADLYNSYKEEFNWVKGLFVIVSKRGGLKHYENDHIRYVVPVFHKNIKMEYRWSYNPITKEHYKYPYRSSIIPTRLEIIIKTQIDIYKFKSEPFFVNIYNEREIGERSSGFLGAYVKNLDWCDKEMWIDVYLVDKKYNMFE